MQRPQLAGTAWCRVTRRVPTSRRTRVIAWLWQPLILRFQELRTRYSLDVREDGSARVVDSIKGVLGRLCNGLQGITWRVTATATPSEEAPVLVDVSDITTPPKPQRLAASQSGPSHGVLTTRCPCAPHCAPQLHAKGAWPYPTWRVAARGFEEWMMAQLKTTAWSLALLCHRRTEGAAEICDGVVMFLREYSAAANAAAHPGLVSPVTAGLASKDCRKCYKHANLQPLGLPDYLQGAHTTPREAKCDTLAARLFPAPQAGAGVPGEFDPETVGLVGDFCAAVLRAAHVGCVSGTPQLTAGAGAAATPGAEPESKVPDTALGHALAKTAASPAPTEARVAAAAPDGRRGPLLWLAVPCATTGAAYTAVLIPLCEHESHVHYTWQGRRLLRKLASGDAAADASGQPTLTADQVRQCAPTLWRAASALEASMQACPEHCYSPVEVAVVAAARRTLATIAASARDPRPLPWAQVWEAVGVTPAGVGELACGLKWAATVGRWTCGLPWPPTVHTSSGRLHSGAGHPPTPSRQYTRRLALVVGCAAYTDHDPVDKEHAYRPQRGLNGSVQDAEAFEKVLCDDLGFRRAPPDTTDEDAFADCDVVLRRNATRQEFRDAWDALMGAVSAVADDPDATVMVVLYFSGHGMNSLNSTFLVPVDTGRPLVQGSVFNRFDVGGVEQTTVANFCFDYCLSLRELIGEVYQLRLSAGSTFLCFLDCCRSDDGEVASPFTPLPVLSPTPVSGGSGPSLGVGGFQLVRQTTTGDASRSDKGRGTRSAIRPMSAVVAFACAPGHVAADAPSPPPSGAVVAPSAVELVMDVGFTDDGAGAGPSEASDTAATVAAAPAGDEVVPERSADAAESVSVDGVARGALGDATPEVSIGADAFTGADPGDVSDTPRGEDVDTPGGGDFQSCGDDLEALGGCTPVHAREGGGGGADASAETAEADEHGAPPSGALSPCVYVAFRSMSSHAHTASLLVSCAHAHMILSLAWRDAGIRPRWSRNCLVVACRCARCWHVCGSKCSQPRGIGKARRLRIALTKASSCDHPAPPVAQHLVFDRIRSCVCICACWCGGVR